MAPEISVVVLACRQAVVERGQDRLRQFKLKTDLERLFLAGSAYWDTTPESRLSPSAGFMDDSYRLYLANAYYRPQPDRRLVRAAVVQAAAPSLKPAGYPIHTPRPIWPLAQYVKLAAIRRLDDLRGSSDLSDSLWVAVDRQSLSER